MTNQVLQPPSHLPQSLRRTLVPPGVDSEWRSCLLTTRWLARLSCLSPSDVPSPLSPFGLAVLTPSGKRKRYPYNS